MGVFPLDGTAPSRNGMAVHRHRRRGFVFPLSRHGTGMAVHRHAPVSRPPTRPAHSHTHTATIHIQYTCSFDGPASFAGPLPVSGKTSHTFSYIFASPAPIIVSNGKTPNGLFDDDCKSLAAQISAVLENNKHVFILGYGFENDQFGKKVMVYKKTPVPELMQPLGLKQLRKPHLPNISQARLNKDSSNTKSLMSSFKAHCLNSTLKFVKNDAQLVLQYPDMSSEQVEFVNHMITQCLAPKDATDMGPGCQGMFHPLAEALRVFRMKYQFKLNSVEPMHGDMKRLCFEKIPIRSKFKKVDLDTISISSEETNVKKINVNTTSNFVKETFFRIKEFLSNESECRLTFPNLTVADSLLVMSWKKLVRTDTDEELKPVMDVIRNIIEGPNEMTVRTTLLRTGTMHRTVCLIKKNNINITKKNEHNQLLVETPTTNLQTAPLINKQVFRNTLDNSVSAAKKNTMELGNDENCMSCNSGNKEKKIDKIKNNTDWLINTLTKLKEFILDEAQASVHLSSLGDQQITAITKAWQNISKNNYNNYSPDVKMLLVELKRLLKVSTDFTVLFEKTSATNNKTRDVFFYKKPCFPATESKTKSEKPKEVVNRPENAPAKSAPKVKAKEPIIVPTAKTNSAKTSSSAKCIPKASSVTSLSGPKASVKARPKSANVSSKVLKAKNKLLEALSQPLVSEKGIKIMRNMGWEGGALGARGDGIVEPIMLTLDLAKRAGLGSLKLPLKVPEGAVEPGSAPAPAPSSASGSAPGPAPPRAHIKTDVLQAVTSILMTAQPAAELDFPEELTLKDWSFVRHIVNAFNNRFYVSIDPPSSMELCNTIMNIMWQTDDIITACWGVTKKNILFVLSKYMYQLSDFDSKNWCSVVNFENIKKKASAPRSKGHSNKAAESFRFHVMTIILDFCEKSPSKSTISKDVFLKDTMVPKQLNYIKDVISRLNNKSRSSSDSDKEKTLFNVIKMKIEGFELHVEFPLPKSDDGTEAPKEYKCIRLHKIFPPQYTTSSPTPATGIFNIDKSVEPINKKITNSQKIEDFIKVMDKNLQDINILKTVPLLSSNDTKNENNIESDSWRHNTIGHDKVVDQSAAMTDQSAAMADQSAPKVDHSAPIADQSAAMIDQSAAMIDHSEAMIDQSAPKVDHSAAMTDQSEAMADQSAPMTDQSAAMTDQSAAMIDQSAPKVDQSAPIHKMTEDCICCLADYVDFNTLENENPVTDGPTTEDEGSPHDPMITDKLHVYLQTLTINDHTPVNEQLECPEDNLRGLPEQNNTSPSKLNETYSDDSQTSDSDTKEDDLNNATNKDIGKRIRSNAQTPDRLYKKCKYASVIIISITPNNYPQSEITHKMAGEIQKSILDSIDYTAELPLLKCHGIQNGALVYSCHTRKSYNLIVNVVKSLDFNVCVMKERRDMRCKMSVKMNSYIDESVDAIFDRLETYNMCINTKDWTVIKVERSSDIIVIYVETDECSFNLIADNKFSLYSGTDDAKFSIVWD